MAFKGANRTTAREQQSINELFALIESSNSKDARVLRGVVGMDAATSKPAASRTQLVRSKRSNRSVSAFYAHPGQGSLDSSIVDCGIVYGADGGDTRTGKQREQDLIASEVNDPESFDDALSSEEREQLEVSLRAPESTTRNTAAARETGLERFNRLRLGNRVARVS